MQEEEVSVDSIVSECFKKFNALPKNGKPAPDGKQWTILAAILGTEKVFGHSKAKIVSLGTGNKCLSPSKMSPKGDVLNDCHAEIIARRSFLRYLWSELSKHVKGENSIFEKSDEVRFPLRLKPDVSFTLYISHSPCGDASLGEGVLEETAQTSDRKRSFSETEESKEKEDQNENKEDTEEKAKEEEGPAKKKRRKTGKEKYEKRQSDAVQTTGARSLQGEAAAPNEEGIDRLTLGILRTKPGRGERTTSLSCSDKIAKWNALGVQGALLSHFIEPIYLKKIIIGDLFNKDAAERALHTRIENIEGLKGVYSPHKPSLLSTERRFSFGREAIQQQNANDMDQPSSVSINWSFPSEHEVVLSTMGKKLGVNKSNWDNPKLRSSLTKADLFLSFWSIVKMIPPSSLPTSISSFLQTEESMQTYWNCKRASMNYEASRQALFKHSYFASWLADPPELENFIADGIPRRDSGATGQSPEKGTKEKGKQEGNRRNRRNRRK